MTILRAMGNIPMVDLIILRAIGKIAMVVLVILKAIENIPIGAWSFFGQ